MGSLISAFMRKELLYCARREKNRYYYILIFRMYVISIFMIASIAIAGEAVPDLRVYTTEGNKEECSKNQ